MNISLAPIDDVLNRCLRPYDLEGIATDNALYDAEGIDCTHKESLKRGSRSCNHVIIATFPKEAMNACAYIYMRIM